MILSELTPEKIAEMKRIYEAYRPLLHPNRRAGAEVDAYFRSNYPYQQLDDCAFQAAAAANIMENEHSCTKLQDGTPPDIRCYRTGDVLVGIDLISGEFHVEAADMAAVIPIHNDLFTFRGLSKDDLENFVLVAEYVRLTQNSNIGDGTIFHRNRPCACDGTRKLNEEIIGGYKMKTLNVIQKLSKIGKVLSKIMFIFCIVGFCGCIAGILSMALGAPTLKFGDVTLEGILNTEAEVTIGTVYAAMVAGMILCVGEAVLAKFAEHYFKRELADGTPFSLGGAKEMQRLGILTICIPIGIQIIAEIVYAVMEQTMQGVAPLRLDNAGSVALGVMFLVVSLICKYGAEIYEESKNARNL